MTDTHDTNLPEKPVELEEEKKTAEVSEPATTETPAEEIVSEKPVEPVQKLTKEEILAKLKEVVADVENVAKPEIDGLKQSFYKLHNAEQDAARKLFVKTEAPRRTLFHKQTVWRKSSRISCPSSKKKKCTHSRTGEAKGNEPAGKAFHHRRAEGAG